MSLGSIQSALVEISEHEDGRRTRLVVDAGPASGLVTIDVGGGQGAAVEEYIRAMYDALRSIESVIEDPAILLGELVPRVRRVRARDSGICLWTTTLGNRRFCSLS